MVEVGASPQLDADDSAGRRGRDQGCQGSLNKRIQKDRKPKD
jgi:hypothetical protein